MNPEKEKALKEHIQAICASLMPRSPNQKQQQDLGIRLEQLKSLFTQIQPEIEHLSSRGDLAPSGAWIVRYQARGRGGVYWYYKWQSHEPIFVTKEGKKSCHKYIGKAGSPAYLKAVEMLMRRTLNRRVRTSPSYSGTGIVGCELKKQRDITRIKMS